MSQRSSLVLQGAGITVRGLDLDGALVVRAGRGVKVALKRLAVRNKGWEWRRLVEGEATEASEEERMRGFTVVKHETRVIEFSEPGEYVVEE